MEIHLNNGIVEFTTLPSFADEEVIVVKKVKGTHIRFTRSALDSPLMIATLNSKLTPTELSLQKEIVRRYNIEKAVKAPYILYGVITYIKKIPVLFVYNQTENNNYVSWLDFESFCIKNNLPISSPSIYGILDKDYSSKDVIIRPAEAHSMVCVKADSRIYWRKVYIKERGEVVL